MADPQGSCVFCDIIAGQAPATVVRTWRDAIAIVPLNPVTDGHSLVIPTTHVRDVAEDPKVSAQAMAAAAELAAEAGSCNVITSRGEEATQTVFHLHIHVVPRRAGDGLALPWTAPALAAQERAAAVAEIHTIVSEVRRGTAERIAAAILADADPLIACRVGGAQWEAAYRAARVARQIGEDRA